MDMFKLLARSTDIQKSIPTAKKISDYPFPSAGVSQTEYDHTSAERSDAFPRHLARGVKRKRDRVEKEQGREIAPSKNTSRDDIKNMSPSNEGEPVQGKQFHGSRRGDEIACNLYTVAPTLSKEECRQTLKRHRIKVTVLQQPRQKSGGHNAEIGGLKGSARKESQAQLFPQPLTTFGLLRSRYGISRRVMDNLKDQGYTEPTEVQLGSLPILLGSSEDCALARGTIKKTSSNSRANLDLLTVAPTGSGKTLCFMIHLIHGLLEDRQIKKKDDPKGSRKHQVQALIIAPTHELVDQIVNEGRKLALGSGIKVSGLQKGTRLHSRPLNSFDTIIEPNEKSLESRHSVESVSAPSPVMKADIVVSTPLMLLHAISEGSDTPVPLPEVRFLVFDEADILLDPLFREQTLDIWGACTHPVLQTSLWSATIGSSIESLAQSFNADRRRKLDLRSEHNHIVRLVVGLKDSAIPNITHRLVYAASEQGKLLALRQLLHPSAAPTKDSSSLQPPFLIFTQTIARATALHSELLYDIPLEAGGSSRIAVLHSDLSDATRSNIMAGFRKGDIWILITTDLLARGVDFRGMNGVVNYDIPSTGAAYVHRVGRTGRQGREGGVAVTLYTKDDIPYVKNVANVIAASERAHGKRSSVGADGMCIQPWLLDALPNVSKKTKKELKHKGVESRRTVNGEGEGRLARKMRISTKSGYDRRLENKKKGAVIGSQRRHEQDRMEGSSIENQMDEWEGIDG